MSEAVVLEFDGVDATHYQKVNEILGLDPATRAGDWPDGLTSHTGGASADGFLVFEVWESQEAQETFMNSRLGAALGQAGVPEPKRVEWFSVEGHYTP